MLVFTTFQLDKNGERVQNSALILKENVPLLTRNSVALVEFGGRLVVMQFNRDDGDEHEEDVTEEGAVAIQEAPHQMPFFRRYSGSPTIAANRISKLGLSPW